LLEEVAQLVEFGDGHVHIFDFVGPFVVQGIARHLNVAFVAGLIALGLDRLWQFVHHVSGRQCDVEDIVLARGLSKLNRIFSWFPVRINENG
jgi:hypothetical protein